MASTDLRQFEQLRKASYEQQRDEWSDGDADAQTIDRSQYGRLIRAVSDAALEHADLTGLDWHNHYQLENWIADGASVVRSLQWALGARERVGIETFQVWSHRLHPMEIAKRKNTPLMDRMQIEGATDEYLALPYRVPALDRLFVDILVALEMFAYADEVLGNKMMSGGGPSPLKLKPIRSLIVGQIANLVFALVVGAIGYGLSGIGLFPTSWLPGMWIVLILIFFSLAAFAIIVFPKFWLAATKARKAAVALMSNMTGVYAELGSSGSISARHIEQRARETASAGVIWPGPLFVLLDDINRRGGRI